jgi:glucose/arabinose dehydrogenase
MDCEPANSRRAAAPDVQAALFTGARRVFALLLGIVATLPALAAAPPVERLRVPPGFRVELVSDAVPNARAMTLGPSGNGRSIVYVGSMQAGKVYAVEMAADRPAVVRTIVAGLQLPAGVAWRDGRLYVSAVSRIVRFDGIDDRLANPPAPVLVTDRLPTETHHGAKYIAFGPDGRLYVAVGSPCNVCKPDERHGVIERMDADGGHIETVARGIRNSVGFDWNPADRSLWFTDNGRDMLGDDMPGDELNRVEQAGQDFGYPYCHQGDIADPEFGAERPCSAFEPPRAKLGAHVAALGMRFYRGAQFPEAYRRSILVAEHGSWNRTRKSGYRVVRLGLDANGRVESQEPFVEGWLQRDGAGRETVWGRPADVLPLPDGSLLISDDTAGAIYRVVYGAGAGR